MERQSAHLNPNGERIMTRPRDTTDLLLAPVALEIDQRLQSLAGLDRSALDSRIAWETNMAPLSEKDAKRAVVADLAYLIGTHGWDISWDARGIRLKHGKHSIVLGVPDNVRSYVSEAGRQLAGQA
jgi:hypothetical protein